MLLTEYEVVVLTDRNIDEATINVLQEKINKILSGQGKIESWQKLFSKRFAYPVKHRKDGHVFVFNIHSTPDRIEELNNLLRYSESVLRFLITKKRSCQ